MKQVECTIMGHGYVLACPDDGESLLRAAVQEVDREMSAIRDGNKVKARDRIAVLAALNLAYRLAERGEMQVPSRNASRQRSPSAEGPARAPEDGTAPDIDVRALLDRIDSALGSDGRLL